MLKESEEKRLEALAASGRFVTVSLNSFCCNPVCKFLTRSSCVELDLNPINSRQPVFLHVSLLKEKYVLGSEMRYDQYFPFPLLFMTL